MRKLPGGKQNYVTVEITQCQDTDKSNVLFGFEGQGLQPVVVANKMSNIVDKEHVQDILINQVLPKKTNALLRPL